MCVAVLNQEKITIAHYLSSKKNLSPELVMISSMPLPICKPFSS